MNMPTIEQNSQTSDAATSSVVLEMRDVTFGNNPETSLRIDNMNLKVRPSDLVMVRTNASQNVRRFASMLQGLEKPRKGNVLFCDHDWSSNQVETELALRGKIGRVFDGQGWVANLSVKENLLLAKLHHGFDMATIERELRDWMAWFQMGKLTRKRPSFVEASHLQVYQWIRAFLGTPTLLVLERPMRKVAAKVFHQFLAAVNEMRRRGSAVVWIAGNTLGEALEQVSPQVFLDLRPGEKTIGSEVDFDFEFDRDRAISRDEPSTGGEA